MPDVPRHRLVVMARSTRPGTGKTRLRRQVGDAVVDRLVVAFTADTLDWSARAGFGLLVAHAGPAEGISLPAGRAVLVEQSDGDLGRRIASAVDAAFHDADRVVVIGTDSPTLPPDTLALCFDALDLAPASLVPAEDGGWVALGLVAPLGTVLDGVTWSTSGTGAETAAALTRAGRAPVLLPPWYDIDDTEGLRRLSDDLERGGSGRAPRTAEVIAALGAW